MPRSADWRSSSRGKLTWRVSEKPSPAVPVLRRQMGHFTCFALRCARCRWSGPAATTSTSTGGGRIAASNTSTAHSSCVPAQTRHGLVPVWTKIRDVESAALARVLGCRYVVPLREGGSLPAVVDTDADGSFVVKFRGAGQGPRALVAEVLVALIAQALDLPVPRPAVVDLEDGFGRSEPDPEIQDILRGSVGANFGLEFLHGALAY